MNSYRFDWHLVKNSKMKNSKKPLMNFTMKIHGIVNCLSLVMCGHTFFGHLDPWLVNKRLKIWNKVMKREWVFMIYMYYAIINTYPISSTLIIGVLSFLIILHRVNLTTLVVKMVWKSIKLVMFLCITIYVLSSIPYSWKNDVSPCYRSCSWLR